MRKPLLIVLAVFVLFIGFLFALPYLFKGKIEQELDKALHQQVNATVYYDLDKLSLSIFSNFPHITASLDEFGVVNKAPFEGDTLADVGSFSVVLDIMSVISGEQMEVKAIELDKPRIKVTVLKDGRASYDIALPDITEQPVDTAAEEPADFNLKIERWAITNGVIEYRDYSSPMTAKIVNLNHEGSGDFSLDEFDLKTTTTVDALSYSMDGISYMAEDELEAKLDMHINQSKEKYTFSENHIRLNAFVFGFDGFVQMMNGQPKLDLEYHAEETSFKSFLSLIPAAYTEDFAEVKSEGSLAFDGFAKGLVGDSTIPSFEFNLKVKDGMFQYPDLPKAAKDIQLDLQVANESGLLEQTKINLRNFAMKLGEDPLKAQATIEGLEEMLIDAMVNAKVDLAGLASVLPMEGVDLKGQFSMDAQAKGTYNGSSEPMQLPNLKANLKLIDGYLSTPDMPAPLDKLQFTTQVRVPKGNLDSAWVQVKPLTFTLHDRPFRAAAEVQNLNNYQYSAAMEGSVDLAEIQKMLALEGMDMKGLLEMDITTSGNQEAIEAEAYEQLPTTGTMKLSSFEYRSQDLAQPVSLQNLAVAFDPEALTVKECQGKAGSSDFQFTGSFCNYLTYALQEDGVLKGSMDLKSSKLDANEWLEEEESAEASASEPKDTATSAAVVPRTLDLIIAAEAGQILYDTYDMKDFKGKILIKDGIATLDHLDFNMYDAHFYMDGFYDSRDTINPKVSFATKIEDLEIPRAYKEFAAISKTAPVAKNMQGKMGLTIDFSTLLQPDMMPKYSTLSGAGFARVKDAVVKNLQTNQKIQKATGYDGMNNITINNKKIEFEIRDGRLFVEPFTLEPKDGQMTIEGSSGFDNTLDYNIDMEVPAGVVGNAVNKAVSSYLGGSNVGDRVQIDLKLTGTNDDPKVKVVSVGGAGKSTVNKAVDKAKEEAKRRAKEEAEKARREAERRAREAEERAKREAERKAREAKEKAKKEAKEKAKEKAKDLKDKFGW